MPSRCSCAASTRARARTSSSQSAGCRSTRAATCTATATRTRTSSSPSWSSRCALSRGRTTRVRETMRSPAARTTSSGSNDVASRRAIPPVAPNRAGAGSLGSDRREHAHLRRGGDLTQDRRLWPEPHSPARVRDGAVRGTLWRDRLVAAHHAGLRDALSIRLADPCIDYASGKIGFYDSYDLSHFAREQVPEGGDASRYSIAADIETHPGDAVLSQQVFVVKRDMRLLENFTGFLLDVQEPLQSLDDQRGDMLDLDVHELTIGARGSARLAGSFLGQRQELELGYFARGDDAAGKQERLEASTGVPYRTETDLDAQIGDIGLYGDANLHLRPWLSLRGGAGGPADLRCARQLRGPHRVAPVDDEPAHRPELPHPARHGAAARARSGHRDLWHRDPAARVADHRAAPRRFALRELRQRRPLRRPGLHHAGRPGAVRAHRSLV